MDSAQSNCHASHIYDTPTIDIYEHLKKPWASPVRACSETQVNTFYYQIPFLQKKLVKSNSPHQNKSEEEIQNHLENIGDSMSVFLSVLFLDYLLCRLPDFPRAFTIISTGIQAHQSLTFKVRSLRILCTQVQYWKCKRNEKAYHLYF